MSYNQFRGVLGRLARLALSAVLLAGLAFSMLPAQAARAATFTVDTLTDENDYSCSDDCSLRDAITLAGASGDTIDFAVTGTITLTMGTLTINKSLTIQGPGASNLTISTVAGNRIFVIASTGSLTISGVTIANASVSFFGAGFYVNQGSLTITDSLVHNNFANGFNGGGIYNALGTVSIASSTLSNNNASGGGGIYNEAGTVNITNSTFLLNTATVMDGGGIFNYGYDASNYGVLTVTHSSFEQNTASGSGGGICDYEYGQMNISESSFTDNQAAQDGGGIYHSTASSTITNTTFSANTAGHFGGGIDTVSNLTVKYATFSQNVAASGGGIYNEYGATTVNNSIIAASTGGNCAGIALAGSSGMADDATCLGLTQKTLTQLKLGTLTGSPAYYPLLATSVAIDAASGTCPPPANDQRGQTRPLDGDGNGTAKCDMGSFEREESTSTAINSDTPDPSVTGQTVSVSVTVSGTASKPTGTVGITGTDSNCSITLVAGVGNSAGGSCNVRFDSTGSKTITATYNGDATHSGSSTSNGHTVNPANTTTTITLDDPDPSLINTDVTVDFTVTSAGGTPTGNVTVSDGVDSCMGTVAAGTCTINLRTPGERTLTATYAGDANFNGSSDTEEHTVNKKATTTTITADDPDPSLTGDAVTVNFTVTSAGGIPTGDVTVSDGVDSCNGTVDSGTCSITLTTAGARTLTAAYAGDASFDVSSDTEEHTVNKKATTTTITADDPDPSPVGEAVTVNYSVTSASGTPTGDVTVSDGVDSCMGTVAAGTCTINLTTLGERTLTATYSGDASFDGSSDTEAHTVNKKATTTTITTDNPDPSVVGQAVTVNYSVTSADGTPTGDVTVSDGIDSCMGTVAAGTCTINLRTLGARTLTATYAGDASFDVSSDTEEHAVNKVPTTTTLASSANPSGKGQSVTFTATVTATSGTPTGTVVFKSDGTTITGCEAKPLSGGKATCAIASLASGKHSITAAYSGDATYAPSTSSALTQRVKYNVTYKSTGSYDGYILESSETSGKGGTMDNAGSTFYVGDNAQKMQYRGILSFNTTVLPDTAVITKVTLKLKLQGTAGASPFNTHGNLLVDVRKGAFSGNNALQLTDFQAASSKDAIGSIPKTPVSGWYTKTWTSGIFTYINKTGVTQFRLRFTKDDDNDAIADYLKFYSGNAGTAYRPQLIIEYYVP